MLLGSEIRDLRTGHKISDIPRLASYVRGIEHVECNAQVAVTFIAINSIASFTTNEKWKVGKEFISQGLVGPATNTLRKFCRDVRCPEVARIIADFFAIVSLDRDSPSVLFEENAIPALLEALGIYRACAEVCVPILDAFSNILGHINDSTKIPQNEAFWDLLKDVIEKNFSNREIIFSASQVILCMIESQEKSIAFVDESLIKYLLKALRAYADDPILISIICPLLSCFSHRKEGETLLVSMSTIQVLLRLLNDNMADQEIVDIALIPLGIVLRTSDGVSIAVKEGIVNTLLKVIDCYTPENPSIVLEAFECYINMLNNGT